MKAIILSGMPGAGKTTVAQILGKKLKLRIVGMGDILKEMAKERGYKVTGLEWWDTEEGIRFAKERAENLEFDKEADKMLVSMIKEGNVIITSYTAPWLTRDGFKIWLEAKPQNRAARLAKRDNTELEEAVKTTKIRDEEDFKRYKKLYNFELGNDTSPFDLIIDTNNKTPEQIAEIIIKNLKFR